MEQPARDHVTTILGDLARGDPEAAHRLMPLVYEELRALADAVFRRDRSDQTLQPTAVVHEAYLRMIGTEALQYENRAHFMAVAAKVMRNVLIDSARRRNAQKRGGARMRVTLEDAVAVTPDREADLLELDEALRRLEALDERKARIVELRFFGGLGIQETADTLGLARSTVTEDWRFARAWLANELRGRNEH